MKINDYAEMLYRCGRCNFCRGTDFNERCPEVFTQKWESSTARGRMTIARAIFEGELEYSSEMVERIFGCFMCARCTEECKKAAQIDVVAITKAMREDISRCLRTSETFVAENTRLGAWPSAINASLPKLE